LTLSSIPQTVLHILLNFSMINLLLSGCCDFKTSTMKPVICVFIDGPVQGSHKLHERFCVNLEKKGDFHQKLGSG